MVKFCSRFLLLFICLYSIPCLKADDTQKIVTAIFGDDKNQKFSLHQPFYFIFGDDDLKLQFSFKYRMARNLSFYFAYSQVMFWDIYEKSKPFEDVNYRPELFYRFLEGGSKFFQSVDMGYLHTSNGQSGDPSRSLDRVFIRSNLASKIKRHNIGAIVMAYAIYNEDKTNADIVKHLGYWDATFYISDLFRIERQRMDVEIRLYAGEKGYDVDQGAYQLGFIYRTGSDNFNPSFYLQRFEGYSENLLNYKKKTAEWRLGLMLAF